MENHQQPMSFWDAIAHLLFIIFLYCSVSYGHYYLLLFAFLITSAFAFFWNWKAVIKKLKWTWTTFVVSTLILFISRILAVHHYNGKYGIFPEYLNYSVSAWALIIACTVFIFFPIFCWVFIFFYRALSNKFTTSFANLSHCATCICIWCILGIGYFKAEQYDRFLLLLDSYQYSDCNTPSNTLAIRKNKTHCYQFIFNATHFIEMKEYSSLKP